MGTGWETFRRVLILIKNSKNNPFLGFGSAMSFGLRFLIFSGGSHLVKINMKNGGRILIRKGSSDLEVLIQHIAYKELYNDQTLELEPRCVLDAGSNIGLSIFVFRSMFPNASIIGLEPDPDNFTVLEKAVSSFPNKEMIHLFQAAFTAKDQEGLSIKKEKGNEYSASVQVEERGDIQGLSFASIKEKTGLDPDLLKIDIEGGELGLMEDTEIFKDLIYGRTCMIELHGSKAYQEYFSLMKSFGIQELRKMGEYWVSGKD